MNNTNKAVVIGAGFGGLALAIRLQASGISTALLEGRDKPGGRAYVYEDQGFTFDAGPTVITDPSALEELFAAAGKKMSDYVEMLPVSPFYRLCWEDGTHFDYANDQEAIDRQIHAMNPADVDGYRKFLAYSEAVFAEGYLKLGAVPFLSFRDMIAAGPQLAKLEAWKSVYGMVSRFIQNEKLRQVFSFHSLLVGGNPFATSSIYTLIHALERKWGVWYPKGGTGALVRAMVKLFEDIGGTFELNAKVEKIEMNGKQATGVRLADGRVFAATAVASNADVVHTYAGLLKDHPRGQEKGQSLTKKRFSNSLFVLYFGLDKHHEQLQHHTVCFGPRYQGLIQDIFNAKALPTDFSLYLHAPCVTDPSLGAARLRQPLRAGAGAAPGQCRYRLGRRRPALPRPYFRLPRTTLHAGPARPAGDQPFLHAVRFPRPVERPRGLGVFAGTDPDAERLVPSAQPRQ